MAQETKTSPPADGALREILAMLERKIRNLEKRKTRLETVEKDLELGKEVSKNQREALEKKEQVLETLDMVREFLTTAGQLIASYDHQAEQKARKAQREQDARVLKTVEKLLRFQTFLELGLQKEEIDDNKVLDALNSAYEDTKKKNHFEKAARLWMNVLEAKSDEIVPEVTFEVAHKKLVSIGEFLDRSNDPLLSAKNTGYVRGDSPSSACDSDTIGSQVNDSIEKQDIVRLSPFEDSLIEKHMEAEQKAQFCRDSSGQRSVSPVEQQESQTQHYVLRGVSVMAVSPDEFHEEIIQFGSVDHLVTSQQNVQTMDTVRNPSTLFQDGEFDFLHDDLVPGVHSNMTGNVHMDPAVVAVASSPGDIYDAHYQQVMRMHQQHFVGTPAEERIVPSVTASEGTMEEHRTGREKAARDSPNKKDNGVSIQNKERRSPPHEHQRINNHGDSRQLHHRNSNGVNSNGTFQRESNIRGNWNNRNVGSNSGGNNHHVNWNNRERSERHSNNGPNGTGFVGNNGHKDRNQNGYNNRNSVPRREQTAQRVLS